MATFKYGNASQQFGTGAWNWTTLSIKALLLSAAYVPQPNVDVHVSDIPVGAILARSSGPMTGLAMTNGLATGVIPTFNALLLTQPVVAVALYKDTGVDSTSSLIYYSSDGIGFPFTPLGFNYAVAEDSFYGGWFQT